MGAIESCLINMCGDTSEPKLLQTTLRQSSSTYDDGPSSTFAREGPTGSSLAAWQAKHTATRQQENREDELYIEEQYKQAFGEDYRSATPHEQFKFRMRLQQEQRHQSSSSAIAETTKKSLQQRQLWQE